MLTGAPIDAQEAYRIGDGQAHCSQHRCGFLRDFAVDARLDKMVRHSGHPSFRQSAWHCVTQHGSACKDW